MAAGEAGLWGGGRVKCGGGGGVVCEMAVAGGGSKCFCLLLGNLSCWTCDGRGERERWEK